MIQSSEKECRSSDLSAYAILLQKGSQKHEDRSLPVSFVEEIPQCGQFAKSVCLQNMRSLPPLRLMIQLNFLNVI